MCAASWDREAAVDCVRPAFCAYSLASTGEGMWVGTLWFRPPWAVSKHQSARPRASRWRKMTLDTRPIYLKISRLQPKTALEDRVVFDGVNQDTGATSRLRLSRRQSLPPIAPFTKVAFTCYKTGEYCRANYLEAKRGNVPKRTLPLFDCLGISGRHIPGAARVGLKIARPRIRPPKWPGPPEYR